MNKLLVEELDKKSYRIFCEFYKSEEFKYIKYLTIFNRFDINYNFEEEKDSKLFCCKPNLSSLVFLGLRGLSYESPRMSIFVPSKFANNNYGKKIIDLAAFLTNKMKYQFLELKVDINNKIAINLYTKKGFFIYQKLLDENQLIMRKNVENFSYLENVIFSNTLKENVIDN